MIGWENNQGAYFIKKLQNAIASVETNIGKLSDLATSAKTSIVSAINEVDSNADSANSHIGKLSNLLTTAKNNLVSAINEVFGMANNTEVSTPIEMESGFTITDSKCFKQGKIIVMPYHFKVSNLTANTNTKIATLATEIKPEIEHCFDGLSGSYAGAGTVCKFLLKADGSVMLSVPADVGSSQVDIRGTFIFRCS